VPLLSQLRGFIYWLITSGPIGAIAGRVFRNRCFDKLGPVILPAGAKPNVVSAVLFGVYEFQERTLINRWLPQDLDCVEFGSSIGVVSRVILEKLEVKRRLFAVEASAELLDLATRNVVAAGFSTRFTPIHGAVHYNGEHVVFEEHEEHIRGKIAGDGQSKGVTTPCVTLAQVIQQGGLDRYSLVMDIEGSEFDMIANDSKSLMRCQTIIVELHGDAESRQGFCNKLEALGFTLMEAKHSVFAFAHPSS
jgi:FkbM family methyltransferase